MKMQSLSTKAKVSRYLQTIKKQLCFNSGCGILMG